MERWWIDGEAVVVAVEVVLLLLLMAMLEVVMSRMRCPAMLSLAAPLKPTAGTSRRPSTPELNSHFETSRYRRWYCMWTAAVLFFADTVCHSFVKHELC